MVEETEQELGRVIERVGRFGGPHRRHQRHREGPAEALREAVLVEELAERQVPRLAVTVAEQGARGAVMRAWSVAARSPSRVMSATGTMRRAVGSITS